MYVILKRDRKYHGNKNKWIVDPFPIATEHAAAARQKNIERLEPAMETARVGIDLPS